MLDNTVQIPTETKNFQFVRKNLGYFKIYSTYTTALNPEEWSRVEKYVAENPGVGVICSWYITAEQRKVSLSYQQMKTAMNTGQGYWRMDLRGDGQVAHTWAITPPVSPAPAAVKPKTKTGRRPKPTHPSQNVLF